MNEEEYEQTSSCGGNCSACATSCDFAKPSKADFLVPANKYSKIKKVIGIVSGKGGVGKSMISSIAAVLLNKKGYKTAILDADITGPSIPKAFGIYGMADADERGILPIVTKKGIKLMSVNVLIEDKEAPVIWRGPVIAGTVKQFWTDVVWGDIDYMLIDMPPGTGDVPLTIFQSLPLDGIVVVTSPQDLVSMIVGKAVNMAESMEIPVIGLVENYSYIECGKCGEKISVFGKSHIDEVAAKYNLPIITKLPILPSLAEQIDDGKIEDFNGTWFDDIIEYILKGNTN